VCFGEVTVLRIRSLQFEPFQMFYLIVRESRGKWEMGNGSGVRGPGGEIWRSSRE